MSKTKTAINQAIEYVQNIRNSSKVTDPSEYGRWIAMQALLIELLSTERQQIEDAWLDGLHKGYTGDIGDSADYFTSKYESNG